QRPDRRALVDVDVLDAQLAAGLEVPVGVRIGKLPAPRAIAPLGGVELDAFGAEALDVLLELLQPIVALTRVPTRVVDKLAWVLLAYECVALGGVEALLVPLGEIGRLEDGDIDVAVLEDVLHEILFRVLLEVLEGPVGLLRAEPLIRVEALDPA